MRRLGNPLARSEKSDRAFVVKGCGEMVDTPEMVAET